jgi:GNAT superfamily N-acetyltransferase
LNQFESISKTNLAEIHQLFINNVHFLTVPFDDFQRGSIEDPGFDTDLSLIIRESSSSEIIAAILCVIRKGWVIGKNCIIKALVVDEKHQRQQIGSNLLKEVITRAKSKLHWGSFIRFGDSPPGYWTPGVDLRHTSLIYFLKKHGFKQFSNRYNLIFDLHNLTIQPSIEKKGYNFERITPENFEDLFNFVHQHFSLGAWPEETKLSYKINPPSTFVAKNSANKIVGWASHSIDFPGTFGPTGVLKTLRGIGIGGELLKWCMWDMKQSGLKECVIRWVMGDTIKFYSKTLGAYIGQVFYTMAKRL